MLHLRKENVPSGAQECAERGSAGTVFAQQLSLNCSLELNGELEGCPLVMPGGVGGWPPTKSAAPACSGLFSSSRFFDPRTYTRPSDEWWSEWEALTTLHHPGTLVCAWRCCRVERALSPPSPSWPRAREGVGNRGARRVCGVACACAACVRCSPVMSDALLCCARASKIFAVLRRTAFCHTSSSALAIGVDLTGMMFSAP